MDRVIVYQGAIPQDTDVLLSNKNPYIAISKLAGAVLGTTQILNAFACTPTSPASLSVNVGPGECYSLQEIDPNAYGSISSDTSDQIVKQGITLATITEAFTAPVTIGYSVNYLIEIIFNEQDTNSVVLPYYNSADINSPFSGPGNSGDAQNTSRQDTVTIAVKTGTPAPTGTQTTPSPDTGYTGAWVVTVAYGQTTIISGNISQYASASFINETLTQKISQATADTRYGRISFIQNNSYLYSADTGTANTYVGTLSPVITSYVEGMRFTVKIANANTGASTLNFNALGAKNIVYISGSAINGGDLQPNQEAEFLFDGTNFQLLNPYYGPAYWGQLSIGTEQTIPANFVQTTVLFNNVVNDSNSWYSSSHNGWLPTLPGKSRCTISIYCQTPPADILAFIAKNGSNLQRISEVYNNGTDAVLTGTFTVHHGSTDYINVNVVNSHASTTVVIGATGQTVASNFEIEYIGT